MASNMGEDQVTSDLEEMIAAMEEPIDELTTEAGFVGAIALMQARCRGAVEGLRASRSLYEADQTENKVAAMTYAEDVNAAVEEAGLLEEALRTRLVGGRAGRALKAGERMTIGAWLDGVFEHTPSWWGDASQNACMGALTKMRGSVVGEGSLATQDERAPFVESVQRVERSYAALVAERLDDKPLSNALKAAKVNALAQRSAGRKLLQAILESERKTMTIEHFLTKRRAKTKPPTQD